MPAGSVSTLHALRKLTSVRVLYPVWSILFVVAFTWQQITVLLGHVRQWMIDAEYVLEERVENYQPDGDDDEIASGTATTRMLPIVEAAPEREDDEWEDIADDARGVEEREFEVDVGA